MAITFLLLISSCGNEAAKESTASNTTSNSENSTSVPKEEFSLNKSDLNILTVSKGNKKRSANISGRVIPKNTTQLFAEVQGQILSQGVLFKPGVAFNKGDLLVQIEHQEFKLNLEAQRSAFLNTLTTIMPDMKSDYPDNYQAWLSYVQAYRFGNSLPPLPPTLTQGEKFYVTSYQIYNQYYAIKAAEERLRKYTITAPYAGIITQSNIDIGSLVSPGQPMGTIINRYNYELEAGVDLATEQSLKHGDKVTFTSNDVEGTWTGKVIRKNNIIDPTTQNMPVYFQLSGKGIRAGMYLEGNYNLASFSDVVILPTSATKRDGSVLILDGEVLRNKSIETVAFLTDSVVVKGLEEGDIVVLNNFELPVVGQKVAL